MFIKHVQHVVACQVRALEKYKKVVKDIKKGNVTAQILKINFIIYDKEYLSLSEDEKKRSKGKTISRNTYKKIKALLGLFIILN